MVDRKARDKLAETIEAYLNEEITAFTFDERMLEIAYQTKDETVETIRFQLWFYYDDCKDHSVRLSKEGWNLFQRFLLILRSDAEIRLTSRRVWRASSFIAAAALIVFLGIAFQVGFNYALILVTPFFGVISILISRLNHRVEPDSGPEYDQFVRLAPFASLREVIAVHRRVPHFRKRTYPPSITNAPIRTHVSEFVVRLPGFGLWLLFSPVALAFQALPARSAAASIVLPAAAG